MSGMPQWVGTDVIAAIDKGQVALKWELFYVLVCLLVCGILQTKGLGRGVHCMLVDLK